MPGVVLAVNQASNTSTSTQHFSRHSRGEPRNQSNASIHGVLAARLTALESDATTVEHFSRHSLVAARVWERQVVVSHFSRHLANLPKMDAPAKESAERGLQSRVNHSSQGERSTCKDASSCLYRGWCAVVIALVFQIAFMFRLIAEIFPNMSAMLDWMLDIFIYRLVRLAFARLTKSCADPVTAVPWPHPSSNRQHFDPDLDRGARAPTRAIFTVMGYGFGHVSQMMGFLDWLENTDLNLKICTVYIECDAGTESVSLPAYVQHELKARDVTIRYLCCHHFVRTPQGYNYVQSARQQLLAAWQWVPWIVRMEQAISADEIELVINLFGASGSLLPLLTRSSVPTLHFSTQQSILASGYVKIRSFESLCLRGCINICTGIMPAANRYGISGSASSGKLNVVPPVFGRDMHKQTQPHANFNADSSPRIAAYLLLPDHVHILQQKLEQLELVVSADIFCAGGEQAAKCSSSPRVRIHKASKQFKAAVASCDIVITNGGPATYSLAITT